MKRLTAVGTSIVVVLLVAAPVSGAGPISGSTTVPSPQTSGTTILVDVSVSSIVPVVPFEYAIQNECSLPNRAGSSVQHDDIVYWTEEEGGVPHATMPVYLQSVPTGSKCKVFLMRNNTTVKGSTSSYTVD